jgi:hypothetical protein
MVDALIDAAIIKFGIRGTLYVQLLLIKALAILSGKIHNKSSFFYHSFCIKVPEKLIDLLR